MEDTSKATLVQAAIRQLHGCGVVVSSVSIDGASDNFRIPRILGCLTDTENWLTYFIITTKTSFQSPPIYKIGSKCIWGINANSA